MVRDGSGLNLYNKSPSCDFMQRREAEQNKTKTKNPFGGCDERGLWLQQRFMCHVLQDQVSAAPAKGGGLGRAGDFPSVRREQARPPHTSCCALSLEGSLRP